MNDEYQNSMSLIAALTAPTDDYFRAFEKLVKLPKTVTFDYDPVMKRIIMSERIADGRYLSVGISADSPEKAASMAISAYNTNFSEAKAIRNAKPHRKK